jgi:hypothetical protein
MGLPAKSGHGGEYLKVNDDEDDVLWDDVLPTNSDSTVKHLANNGIFTY